MKLLQQCKPFESTHIVIKDEIGSGTMFAKEVIKTTDMKKEEIRQYLKNETGRDDEMMEEPWEFQSLEDLVDFMIQWEEHYKTLDQQEGKRPNIVAKLTELQKTPIPHPFIKSDKSPEEIADGLKKVKTDPMWLKGFKSGAYWYESELPAQLTGQQEGEPITKKERKASKDGFDGGYKLGLFHGKESISAQPIEVSEEELRQAFKAGEQYGSESMKEFYSQSDEYFSHASNFNQWMQNRLKQTK